MVAVIAIHEVRTGPAGRLPITGTGAAAGIRIVAPAGIGKVLKFPLASFIWAIGGPLG